MKIRQGFVSNSSSSSFICSYCGADVSGWDMGLSEAEMIECLNGHYICESHLSDAAEEILNDDEDGEKRYDFPIEHCPVCNFRVLTDEDGLKYLLKENQKTNEDVLKEVKIKFKTYKEFEDYIK